MQYQPKCCHLLSLFSVAILAITLISCTDASQSTTITTKKTTISNNYTTYTSEGFFSISYPFDWEPAQFVLEAFESIQQDILLSIDSGFPIDKASMIFFSGLPTDLGWEPSMNIVIESSPTITFEDVVGLKINSIKLSIDDYEEISRIDKIINGRKATILIWEGTIPPLKKDLSLQMFTVVDDVVWTITCTPPSGKFDDWEEDFYRIVNSYLYFK
jgi:hypothetical protein